MLRRVLYFVAPSALALAALLLLADPAAAQRRGFRYGGLNYGNQYYNSGYYDPYYGSSYYNNGYYSPYYGNRYSYYDPNYGYYDPSSYGNGWRDARGWSDNRAWTGRDDTSYTYGDYRGGAWDTGCHHHQAHHGGMRDNVAVIELIVPPMADVTVNGERLAQNQGARRQIVTPQIEPNRDFVYEVRMRWNESGRTVDKTRRINFRAGDHLVVDFGRSQDVGYAYGATERQEGDRDRRERNAPAHFDIMVPPSAEIWFNNDKTSQTGSMRSFVTPALEPDRDFTYTVRAKWNQGGTTVDQTRKLIVHGGERMALAFGSGLSAEQRNDFRGDESRRRLPEGARNEDARDRSDENRRTDDNRRGDAAREADNRQNETHEGNFVSFSNDKLTMTDQDGKRHTHTLTNETQIMINGKRANPQDLRNDMRIRVTTPKDERDKALRIEATSKE